MGPRFVTFLLLVSCFLFSNKELSLNILGNQSLVMDNFKVKQMIHYNNWGNKSTSEITIGGIMYHNAKEYVEWEKAIRC